jgi:hypothetical protein
VDLSVRVFFLRIVPEEGKMQAKDTNKKDKHVDVSGKLKRSKTVDVIDRCKSQIRRKLQLCWNHVYVN